MCNRRKLIFGLAMTFGLCALASAAAAQQPQQPSPPPLVVHNLKENLSALKIPVYWIEGGGGNTGVIVGDNGVVVIDAKTTGDAGKEIVADIAKLTPKPITHVIITHSDGDHVIGLVSFPMGLTIIAQENCKTEMEAAITAGGRGAPPKEYLPTQTYADKDALKIDGVRFQLLHFGPAHTSGDTVVYLPDEKVAFSGDILASVVPDPIIHPEKNGSPAGWIKTMQGMLKLNADTFVPGHGMVETKADVEKKLAEVQDKDKQIRSLVAQGKSLDDVKQAMNVPAPAPGGRGPRFPSFAEADYNELTKK
jgi:cyclase